MWIFKKRTSGCHIKMWVRKSKSALGRPVRKHSLQQVSGKGTGALGIKAAADGRQIRQELPSRGVVGEEKGGLVSFAETRKSSETCECTPAVTSSMFPLWRV